MKSIGILNDIFSYNKSGTVYGANVVRNELFLAMIRHSNAEKLVFDTFEKSYNDAMIKRVYKSIQKKYNDIIDLEIINRLDILQKEKKVDVDILHDFGPDFIHGLYFRDKFTDSVPPFTYTIHCSSIANSIFRDYFYKLIMPFAAYDSLICTSNSLKKVITSYMENIGETFNSLYNTNIKYNGRMDVIPLGVDTDNFYPIDKITARKRLNLPEDSFILLWLGRISAYDKADLIPLINVFKRLQMKNFNKKLILIIAGQDGDFVQMKLKLIDYIKANNLSDSIIFNDAVFEDRLYLYNSSNVFVSPIDNIQETFGLTPIEAMACGIPQIVSDWNGYKDTVIDGITGFRIYTYWCKCDSDISSFPFSMYDDMFYNHLLFAQSVIIDTEMFENRVQKLIDDSELLHEMSNNSRKRALDMYSWKNIITKYHELWEHLIDIKNHYTENNSYSKQLTYKMFNNIYSKAYQSYPTYFIELENKEIILTNEGNKYVENNYSFINLYIMQKYFNEYKIADKILHNLYFAKNKKVYDVLNEFINSFNTSVIKRSIMFLAKYDYIKII